MAKYRKKPVVIEAVRVSELVQNTQSNWKDLPNWVKDRYEKGGFVFLSDGISIGTLEGTMKAEYTDMLIQGVQGEIYPCKPDIFAETYELVKE